MWFVVHKENARKMETLFCRRANGGLEPTTRRRLKNLCMEKLHTIGKENLFEALNCSPILSSGGPLKENGTEKLVYSPLSERNLPCQGNRPHYPGTDKASKVGLFLSTPVQKPPSSLPDNLTDSWEDIRKLDEEELWIERTQVVTKEDHLLYFEIAKEIVDNIIENLPVSNMDESTGECDNTVVAADAMKNHLVNGVSVNASYDAEGMDHNGGDVVGDERKEDIVTDIKDVTQNCSEDVLSDQLVEKSGLEEANPVETRDMEDNQLAEKSNLEDERPVEKSALEEVQPSVKYELEDDNDFIHSCSELDTTVKEASVSDDSCLENTVSEEKSLEDLDETVREVLPEEQASSAQKLTEDKNDSEIGDGINLEFDESTFKPATAFGLELDFLEKCGNAAATDYESDLARQSLYVKFDPLVEARKNDQVEQDSNGLSNINPADLLFQGPISSGDLLGMDTPPAKPVVSRRTLLDQAQNSEPQDSTATSNVVAPVDLFELSPTKDVPTTEKIPGEDESSKPENCNVVAEEQSSLVQPLQFSKKDLDKAVEEEREKILTRWNLQNSLHEGEIEKLLQERDKLLKERNEILDESKVVKTLMTEYEQTMAQMIKDRQNVQNEQEKSNAEIVQERDQLQRDLNNTEKSFAHLHEKFGKLKSAVESYRKNEDVLKKVVKDLQEDVKNSEAKYQALKGQAEQKLKEASAEINRVQVNCKSELAGLQAAFKLEKAKNTSLQQSLEQKISENKELTAICDELIGKVGAS